MMQSLIVHVIILLILALSFTIIKKPVIISVDMAFEPVEEISMEPVEIPQLSVEESDHQEDSTSITYTSDILEQGVSVDIDYEDQVFTASYISEEIISPEMVRWIKEDVSSQFTGVAKELSLKKGSSKGESDGIGDAIKGQIDRRLKEYGARTGDVQVSISWDDYNDIDLWVVFEDVGPFKSRSAIGWSNKADRGGFLDIDMNVVPLHDKPVENIVWNTGMAPYGKYSVYVHYYHRWDKKTTTPVLVRIQHDDEIVYKKSMANINRGWTKVYSFVRKKSR